MKNFKYIFLFLFVLFMVVVFHSNHTAKSDLTYKFTINKPFVDVRKDLVRKSTLEELVEMSHGKVIDKKWEKLDLSLFTKNNNLWEIHGISKFLVEINDSNVGICKLEFLQTLMIKSNEIKVQTTLTRPSKNVKTNETYIWVKEENGIAAIYCRSCLIVNKNIPLFYNSEMDFITNKTNEENIKNIEKCFNAVCSSNGFTIPLKETNNGRR